MTTTRTPIAESLRERSPSSYGAVAAGRRVDQDDPQPARMMTASRLCGNKVINHQNETLGQIDEVVIDVPSGRVAYAAMASGGFLGLGERLFAVPWTALRYDAGRECFVMDARKETFENAPGFDKDHWPTEAQREWHDSVHRFYGAPLFWS
jgi:sporulation protein YlmC with PRC-barrel domain